MKRMKAGVIEGPRQLRMVEVPVPDIGPEDVLVKVRNIGICATDLEIYQGVMPYYLTGQASYPIVPGHEWSGEIVEVGSKVKAWKPGDRVTGEITISCGRCAYCLSGGYNMCVERVEVGVMNQNGAAASYMVYPSHALYRIPPSISFEAAALTEPAAIAYRGVEKLKLRPGDRVAVIGAGPIGLLAVQAAKALGAHHVSLFDFRENRLRLGLELGADEAVNLSDAGSLEAILPSSPQDRYTAIVEATGHPSAVESILAYAAPKARIALIGLTGGRKAAINVDHLVTYDLEVHGSLGSPGVWDSTLKLLETGKVRTEPLVTHRFRIEQLEEAFSLIGQKDPSIVKIVLQVN